MTLKIAIAQINATVGDLSGNAARILDFAERAKAQGADLLLLSLIHICMKNRSRSWSYDGGL